MIRPFKAADREIVLNIWRDSSTVAHPFLGQDIMEKAETMIRDTLLDLAEIWVIEADGRPAGFVALLGNEVGGLFLHPDDMGRGLGRALMDHAVSLKGAVTLEVFRDNHIGRKFYARYGFKARGESLDAFSGHQVIRLDYTPD